MLPLYSLYYIVECEISDENIICGVVTAANRAGN